MIIADKVASLTAAQAIASALYHRDRSDDGQHIKVSMLDAMLAFFWPEGMGGITYADNEYDPSETSGSMDLIYPTQDGFITAGVISDKEWVGMCRALDREDLIEDPRFATAGARLQHVQERKEITMAEIAKWPSTDILERLQATMCPMHRYFVAWNCSLTRRYRPAKPSSAPISRASAKCAKRDLQRSSAKHPARSVAPHPNLASNPNRYWQGLVILQKKFKSSLMQGSSRALEDLEITEWPC